MGQIGRFIDKACAEHPALMRRVLDRPFGTLHNWIDFDEEGEACGCLIGTMALVAGVDRDRAERDEVAECRRSVSRALGIQPWSASVGEIERVGIAVSDLAARVEFRAGIAEEESDARTAEMIKRRTARRLGVVYAPRALAAATA